MILHTTHTHTNDTHTDDTHDLWGERGTHDAMVGYLSVIACAMSLDTPLMHCSCCDQSSTGVA